VVVLETGWAHSQGASPASAIIEQIALSYGIEEDMRGTKRISLRREQPRSMVNQENSSRNISILLLQKYTFQDGDVVDDPKVSGYYSGIIPPVRYFHR
jgi:hypothetical protein